MLAVLHDNDFVDDQLLPGLTAQVHLLDGHLAARAIRPVKLVGNTSRCGFLNPCHINGSRCTLTNLALLAVRLVRVILGYDRPQPLHDFVL